MAMTGEGQRKKAIWLDHWQDEADAAFLYRRLSTVELNPEKRDLYLKLADVEDRHAGLWEQVLAEHGIPVSPRRPSLRARLLAWFGVRFRPKSLLTLLWREEGQEVRGYLSLYRQSESGLAAETALRLAGESAEHADALSQMADLKGEPWHRIESGGLLRNVVYGFNDGLTANFGLVAGVVGASVEPTIILLTGIAGMIADALSMGSSGYLAAKSEREVFEHEIAMERDEIQMMPEAEEEELALIYEGRGVSADRAKEMAAEVIALPEQALQEMVREELKIGQSYATPLREGWITGATTAVGAFIPVAPFLVLSGSTAIWTSFAVSMLSHFGVGAARSMFTGRPLLRSGMDMFVVGFGVAGIGFIVGTIVMHVWQG